MVELKQWEEIAELGSKIVDTFKTHPGDDPLRVWMAHYIAELMEKEKTVKTEKQRTLIRKQCSELVMRLWDIRYKFDPNDPINTLNQNIKTLVGKGTFGQPFLSCSKKEETQEEPCFEEYLNSIIKLSEHEKEVVFSVITADATSEMSDTFANEDSQESEKEFGINIRTLLNYRSSLAKKNPILETIIQAKSKEERRELAMKALWDISKKRRKIIKKLSEK